MEWQKILTESQIPMFILAISYFVKRYYDLKSKKVEVNHSIFQQNKINSINRFFSNYSEVGHMWHKLPIWDILEYKITSKELDEIVWPSLNELKKSVLELKIYFNNDHHKYFQELLDNYLLVNNNLGRNYFDYNKDKKVTQKSNDFTSFLKNTSEKNEKLLDDLSRIVRKSFNDK